MNALLRAQSNEVLRRTSALDTLGAALREQQREETVGQYVEGFGTPPPRR
jgi:hypothetical protein